MIGEILVGRYRIDKELGRGGFGETFLARDLQMPKERLCVVKHLKPFTDNPQLIEIATRLFKKEAEILAELGEHPQIPRLYAYFTQGEDFYLVQEFIEGKDLAHEMDRRWTPDEVCRLIVEIMQILEFVHSKGVIHRDIKPQNIICRATDNKLVLIDFGAVKEVSQTAIQNTGKMSASVMVGSLGYMAPEQGNGKPRFSSDIYSVGMMAIEALIGRRPWELPEDGKTGQVVWRHLVGFNNRLLDVIEKMVKYAYWERYGSASEVLTALKNSGAETNLSAEGTSKRSGDERAILWGIKNVIDYTIPIAKPSLEPVAVTPPQTSLPSETAEEFFNAGNAKCRNRDYHGAIADYNEAIGLQPDYAQAYNNRGNAKSALGDKQGAIADYNEAICLQPDLVEAYFNRGNVKADLGDKRGAIADYNEAIGLQPDYAEAYNNRGNAKSALGDKRGAIIDYNEAIGLQPNYAEAYNNRGNAKSALGDKQGAIFDYNEAIRLQPDYALAYSNRGHAKYKSGDKGGALADVNEAIRLQPDLAKAYLGRGIVKYDLGDKRGAITDVQEAARLFQNHGDIEGYIQALDLLRHIR